MLSGWFSSIQLPSFSIAALLYSLEIVTEFDAKKATVKEPPIKLKIGRRFSREFFPGNMKNAKKQLGRPKKL